MQGCRCRNTDGGIHHNCPTIWESDMNCSVASHSDYLTADRLNSVTQIAYKIDGTHGVALTTDLLKLQAYALYRTIGQAPSVRIYFLGQQFRPACSSRACRRCGAHRNRRVDATAWSGSPPQVECRACRGIRRKVEPTKRQTIAKQLLGLHLGGSSQKPAVAGGVTPHIPAMRSPHVVHHLLHTLGS